MMKLYRFTTYLVSFRSFWWYLYKMDH